MKLDLNPKFSISNYQIIEKTRIKSFISWYWLMLHVVISHSNSRQHVVSVVNLVVFFSTIHNKASLHVIMKQLMKFTFAQQ